MLDTVQWQFALDLTGVVLSGVIVTALAGLPVIAVVGELMTRLRQRSSYDKCARQLAALAMALGWLVTLSGAALFWWRLTLLGQGLQLPLPENLPPDILARGQADMLTWVALAGGTFFLSLYFALWRTMRGLPILHQALGGLASIFCYLGVYGLMAVVAVDAAVDTGEAAPVTLKDIFLPGEDAPLWSSLAYLPPLALSLAGALGALWLVVRRNRDDYGRDHYMQMLPWCAVWARNAWMVLWLLVAAFTGLNLWHMHVAEGALPLREIINAAMLLLLWIIPGLLWTVAVRSVNPLRHKLTLLLALVLSMFFVLAVYFGLIGA